MIPYYYYFFKFSNKIFFLVMQWDKLLSNWQYPTELSATEYIIQVFHIPVKPGSHMPQTYLRHSRR